MLVTSPVDIANDTFQEDILGLNAESSSDEYEKSEAKGYQYYQELLFNGNV